MPTYDIAGNVINTQVPYFPSMNWPLIQSDYGKLNLWTFNWIQAFFDTANFVGIPGIIVANPYETNADGSFIASLVQFAYSGERVNIKGSIILATGTDRRGNTINSTPIGADTEADLLQVFAWGGNQ